MESEKKREWEKKKKEESARLCTQSHTEWFVPSNTTATQFHIWSISNPEIEIGSSFNGGGGGRGSTTYYYQFLFLPQPSQASYSIKLIGINLICPLDGGEERAQEGKTMLLLLEIMQNKLKDSKEESWYTVLLLHGEATKIIYLSWLLQSNWIGKQREEGRRKRTTEQHRRRRRRQQHWQLQQ